MDAVILTALMAWCAALINECFCLHSQSIAKLSHRRGIYLYICAHKDPFAFLGYSTKFSATCTCPREPLCYGHCSVMGPITIGTFHVNVGAVRC